MVFFIWNQLALIQTYFNSSPTPPMKNLYSRLTLVTSVTLTLGYFIVSATWTTMAPDATTGTQFTAAIWNSLVGNVNDLNSQINIKSPLISPTFTGIPTAPTPSSADS